MQGDEICGAGWMPKEVPEVDASFWEEGGGEDDGRIGREGEYKDEVAAAEEVPTDVGE